MGGPVKIAEILVYHRALNDAERTAVAAHLGEKYQLDMVLPLKPQPPAAPANLEAAAAGQTAIALTWTASASEGAAYELERKSGGGDFAPVATLPAGTVSYSDTGLNPATTYTYRLRAVKDGRFSAYTAGAAAATEEPPLTVPTGFTVTTTAWNTACLTWTAVPETDAAYELERKTGDAGSAAPYARIAGPASGVTTHADAGLAELTTYTYRLRSTPGGRYSGYSGEVSATTPAKPLPPPPVPGTPSVTASTAISITIAWEGSIAKGVTYEIERSDDGGTTFVQIAGVTGALTCTDTGLTPGATYHYRIHARNSGAASACTAMLVATTVAPPEPPSVLAATAVNAGSIALAWTASPTAGAAYELERKPAATAGTGGGDFEKIAGLQERGLPEREGFGYFDLANGTASYSDTGLSPETGYIYRLRAVLDDNTSDYTGEETATTPSQPPPPQPPSVPEGLTVTETTMATVTLAWAGASGASVIHDIGRSDDDGATFTQITSVTDALAFTDTRLTPGTTYYYCIRARNASGTSGWSDGVPATTESPDGNEFIPMGNLRLWLKADAGVVTDDTGKISQWQDQSDGNHHAYQNSSAWRPMPVADATSNGPPAVHFNATQGQYLALPDFMNGAGEGEVFVVLKAASAAPAASRCLWRMGSYGYGSYYPESNGRLYEDFGTDLERGLGVPQEDITQWHVYNVSSKAGEWVARLNGREQFRTQTNTVAWSTSPRLGYGSYSYFDGGIAEVIVFDRVLTNDEREGLGRYVCAKHTLPGIEPPAAPAGGAGAGAAGIGGSEFLEGIGEAGGGEDGEVGGARGGGRETGEGQREGERESGDVSHDASCFRRIGCSAPERATPVPLADR
ncbi:MAG: fibronectin type III domain-containing protein, partial [Opitutaceae bacterium]|nr:fibronectin type III domain-containing protein [Opitutaceae bacterium]